MNKQYIYLTLLFVWTMYSSCKDEGENGCSHFISVISKATKKSNSKNDTIELIKKIDGILKEKSNCIDIYLVKGDLLMGSNDFEGSKVAFYKACILDTSAVYPLYQLGLLYQQGDKFDSSIYFLSKAIAKKIHGGGIIDFNKLEGVDETNIIGRYDVGYKEIIYQLAVSHYYKHNLKVALDYFNFCIQKGYMSGNSYLYRGSINLELNRKDDACLDFKTAKDQGINDAEVYLKLYCENLGKISKEGNVSK